MTKPLRARAAAVPARYLFSRDDDGFEDDDPVTLATNVFFQMWQRRFHPYRAISEGDVVYIGDPRTRRIRWETRVDRLLTDFRYASTKHALAALRSAYGAYAGDLNDYHRSRGDNGYLLAWSPKVMRKLDVELPKGEHFGRNGYRDLDPQDATRIGLPNPKRSHPLASPPDWYDPGAARTGRLIPVTRYIPARVRHAVWKRDGGRCVGCGTTVNLHLDHRTPFIHGGPASVENLRLVCANSNLRRGASGLDEPLACARE